MNRFMFLHLTLAASMSVAHAADLKITVEGLDGDKGTLYLALYDQNGFPKSGQQIAGTMSKASQTTHVFNNLTPGRYAVSAYQDINSNEKLDKNLVGIPQEPYGFSNNAKGFMGPPKFESAAITLGTENQSIVIKLH